jgi:hypothetical protein
LCYTEGSSVDSDENSFDETYKLTKRLDFLSFVISNSSLGLPVEQVDILWENIILKSASDLERDKGFGWFEAICGKRLVV